MATRYWLMKCEPSAYTILDLQRDGETSWEGVRNYQARNFMRQMALGDRGFFYHSQKQKAIVGIVEVIAVSHRDRTIADPYRDFCTSKPCRLLTRRSRWR